MHPGANRDPDFVGKDMKRTLQFAELDDSSSGTIDDESRARNDGIVRDAWNAVEESHKVTPMLLLRLTLHTYHARMHTEWFLASPGSLHDRQTTVVRLLAHVLRIDGSDAVVTYALRDFVGTVFRHWAVMMAENAIVADETGNPDMVHAPIITIVQPVPRSLLGPSIMYELSGGHFLSRGYGDVGEAYLHAAFGHTSDLYAFRDGRTRQTWQDVLAKSGRVEDYPLKECIIP